MAPADFVAGPGSNRPGYIFFGRPHGLLCAQSPGEPRGDRRGKRAAGAVIVVGSDTLDGKGYLSCLFSQVEQVVAVFRLLQVAALYQDAVPSCDKPQTNWFQEHEYFERTRCVPDEGCPDEGCYACYIIQEELRYRVVREVSDPLLVGRLFAELEEGKKHIGRIMNEWARSQQQVCTRVPDESSGSPPQQAPESRWGSLPAIAHRKGVHMWMGVVVAEITCQKRRSTCGWGSSWPKSTSGSPPKQAPGWGSSWPKSHESWGPHPNRRLSPHGGPYLPKRSPHVDGGRRGRNPHHPKRHHVMTQGGTNMDGGP